MKEWDELIQYHNKENQDDKVYNNKRIAWRLTTCTSTNSSTERAHVVLFLAHFITLTLAQVRALPALHSWSSTCHPCVRPLHLELHFLLPSLPLVCLPLPLLPPLRRAAAGAQQEVHCTTTTSSTSPQVMSPRPMTSTSSRTHRSPSPSRSLSRTRTWMS